MQFEKIGSLGNMASAVTSFGLSNFGISTPGGKLSVFDQLSATTRSSSPLEAGLALRAIDRASGGRQATELLLARDGRADGARTERDTRDSRASDGRDTTRSSGRDTVRPKTGNGPATPTPGTITNGAGKNGFPTPPAAPKSGDGSGTHGASKPGIMDHITEETFYRAADAADALGMNNAARHMRHYLENSGSTMQIDPNKMMKDLPVIKSRIDASYQTNVIDAAKAKVTAEFNGKPMTFQITTPWKSEYATKGMSQDWFYAVGGFSYSHTATVTVTPGKDGQPIVHIDSKLNVFDRYNWDGGKSVTIGPFTVTDERLGQLHKTGLAKEFEVRGSSDLPSVDFSMPKK